MSVDVLMIDDEAELAASVVEYLSAFGVSAVAAACGGWRVARIQASEGIRDV